MLASWSTRKISRLVLIGLLLVLVGLGAALATRFGLTRYYARQAAQALQKQRYPQALAFYEQALHYAPWDAGLHLLAAQSARRAGNFPVARDHLRQYRELLGGSSEEEQVEEYLLRAQSGELDEVQRFLLPYLLQEGPCTPLVLEALTRAYMSQYRMDRAGQCLQRWLELEPDSVEAHFRRALWLTQRQEFRKALPDFQRALDLDPERDDIRLLYADVLHGEKRLFAVAEQYQLVLQHSPQSPAARLGLARVWSEMGKAEDARPLLTALPEPQCDSAEAFWVRGKIEMQTNQPERAESLLRQALLRDPGHRDACYQLILCLNRLERSEEVSELQARFEQIEKDEKRLVDLTGGELNTPRPELYCELAEIYRRLGNRERALHWLRTALRLDPNYQPAQEQLQRYQQ